MNPSLNKLFNSQKSSSVHYLETDLIEAPIRKQLVDLHLLLRKPLSITTSLTKLSPLSITPSVILSLLITSLISFQPFSVESLHKVSTVKIFNNSKILQTKPVTLLLSPPFIYILHQNHKLTGNLLFGVIVTQNVLFAASVSMFTLNNVLDS